MLELSRLRGIFPPILTPLTDEEEIDLPSLRRLIQYVLDGGVQGIWVTGTTGEFPCIDERERAAVVAATVETVNGRLPVIAGIGDCSTRLAVRHARNAKSAGVDAIALTPPHYYVNTADELLSHYRTVRERVDLPLLVYNIPQNVKVKVEVKTVLTLAAEGTVVGIKDSQNDLDWFRQVMIGTRETGREFRGFLGTRYLIDAGLIAGANGAIPSIANLGPKLAVATYERAVTGDWAGAARAQERLGELSVRIANLPSLVPALKGSLRALGVLESARMTLPFKSASSADEAKLKGIIAEVGLEPPI